MDLKCPKCGLFITGMRDDSMLEEGATFRCPNCTQVGLVADYLLKPKGGAQVSISNGGFTLIVCAPDKGIKLGGPMGCGLTARSADNIVALQPHETKDCFWVTIISRNCAAPGPAIIRFRQGRFEVVSCKGEIKHDDKEPKHPLAMSDHPPPGWPTKEDMAGEQQNTKEMAEYADQQQKRAEKAEAELEQLQKVYCSLSIRAGEDRQKINDLEAELSGARARAEKAEAALKSENPIGKPAYWKERAERAEGCCSLLDARWQRQYDELKQSAGKEAELIDRLARSQTALAEVNKLNHEYFERATKAENELAVWRKGYKSLPAAAEHEVALLQEISLLEQANEFVRRSEMNWQKQCTELSQANMREREMMRDIGQQLVNLLGTTTDIRSCIYRSRPLSDPGADAAIFRLNAEREKAMALIVRLKDILKAHNVVDLGSYIQVVSAGVDPNHQTDHCDVCG